MSQGYDKFFKQARQASSTPGAKPKIKFQHAAASSQSHARFELPKSNQVETDLRQRIGMKRKRKARKFPWKLAIACALGAGAAGWSLANAEQMEKYAKQIEITWSGEAQAAEPAKAAAPAAAAKDGKAEVPATSGDAKSVAVEPEKMADLDHLSKLNDRSKELDAREQEISRQEAELVKMKADLEVRLKDLDQMRTKISEMLAERVKVDDQKIDTLVQTYSNMKPTQAAKVLESMDEDLAVEIVSRMKKKNAADIMNLLKPDKAQTFSEKYAGYKRK